MGENRQKTDYRKSLTEILGNVAPELDLNDDEVFFGRILDDYNAYAELLDRESGRLKHEDALEAEYKQNTAASMAEIERMVADEGLDADETDLAIAELKRIASETNTGHYTTDNVKWMLAAMHREADLEAARKEGEIAGRNATIEARLHTEGDGLPVLGGANAGARRGPASIFDIARKG